VSWQLFTWVDWVVVGIISLSTLLSLVRGFAREALSLGAWVLAFILANMWAPQVGELLSDSIQNHTARYVAAFILIFVATLVASNIAIIVVAKALKVAGLSTLDRLLGTVFGFARGLIVVLVLLFVLRELLPPGNQQWLQQAQLVPHLDMVMEWAQRTFSQWGGKLTVPQLSI
jgi:membrane protein required for colicin V production